ncbi:MAG: hypothetical protein A3I11_03970 [Elusimicrobia bacterium RIFCSPLOWO2_02_FULL_39_32]|nr:MAG: hypothetical protein A2034_02810 [Elusimicrobia bacterium GWA2_38_7]OGR79535.1 MAG: hypothetical protein A3B80_02545 [Elusimicrobia bacterium RIFCSPHIGHO2_02_FULL_39_36]OGR92861.1 MAG: hypothetical protein A3I11_03970 [Elusimicrobia bacterium RIFCSPLOWO2_02_FULL_39_32]OGR99646.1 MAG: hypothetical protein A3G85_01335 [Elusimicrobia bacterium RIFCSPLOWO2_12_FULL_39_28]
MKLKKSLFISLCFSILLLFQSHNLHAKPGKIFFSPEEWIKGDIDLWKDESGKEILLIKLDFGSLTIPKSKIYNIEYDPGELFSNRQTKKQVPDEGDASSSPILYEPYIRIASAKQQLDPELIKAVIKQESNFNFKDVSQKGAEGLMQLMPDTAKKLGVKNSFDPWENIQGGTRYLRIMLETFNGDLNKALAAYNAGPGAVKKYGDIPPYKETQGYVKNVLLYYKTYKGINLYSFEDGNGKLVFTDMPYLP